MWRRWTKSTGCLYTQVRRPLKAWLCTLCHCGSYRRGTGAVLLLLFHPVDLGLGLGSGWWGGRLGGRAAASGAVPGQGGHPGHWRQGHHLLLLQPDNVREGTNEGQVVA